MSTETNTPTANDLLQFARATIASDWIDMAITEAEAPAGYAEHVRQGVYLVLASPKTRSHQQVVANYAEHIKKYVKRNERTYWPDPLQFECDLSMALLQSVLIDLDA